MSRILWSILVCHCFLIAFWTVYFYNSGTHLKNSFNPDTEDLQYWLIMGKTLGGGFGVGTSILLVIETLARLSLDGSGCFSFFLYMPISIISFLSHFLGLTSWFTSFIIDQCFTLPSANVPSLLCSSRYTYLHFMIFFGVFAEILLGICLLTLQRQTSRLRGHHRYESLDS